MTVIKKSFSDMVADGLRYLSANTEVTYFGDGSVARALVESTALEVSRLQNFVANISSNSFLSSASGVYLDLFGEMLGIPRLTARTAQSSAEDGTVRFYVNTGTLGSRLPHPTERQKGIIPANTEISTAGGELDFFTLESVAFPINSRSVFVPVRAFRKGAGHNVGANKLVTHNLGVSDVFVTNDSAILTGADVESDTDYKYRLSRAMTTRFGSNRSAVQVAALSQPGIVDVRINEYSRGAGTYDVLLIPRGNRVTEDTKRETLRALNQVTAFGIYPQVREPDYLKFKLSIQLRFKSSIGEGQKDIIRRNVQSSLLNYMGNIPIGGELVINQIRGIVLSTSSDIADMNILEICIDGKQRTLRNINLREDEILIPDDTVPDPLIIL